MAILKNLSEIVGSARKTLSEKSKKNAAVNRLKSIIKTEEQLCEREYIALGKYYYHTLRDKNDIVTEPHCEALDISKEKIEKAAMKLEKYYRDEPEKVMEMREEIKGVIVESEPGMKAYVYLRDEDEDVESLKNFSEGDHMIDEAVEQRKMPLERKEIPDSEEEDAKYLPFE